jgi:hypothetical protein
MEGLDDIHESDETPGNFGFHAKSTRSSQQDIDVGAT